MLVPRAGNCEFFDNTSRGVLMLRVTTFLRSWLYPAIICMAVLPPSAIALAPRQIDKAALPLAGAWDITIHTAHGDRYSWLEIEPSGATLVGRFVGMFGSARPISRIEFANGAMRFNMPRQYEDREFQFEGKLDGDRLTGMVTGYDSGPSAWMAQRAPALKRDHAPEWGVPIKLFDGLSMAAWKPQSSGSNWTVRDHQWINTKSGANLLSVARFRDFKHMWNSSVPREQLRILPSPCTRSRSKTTRGRSSTFTRWVRFMASSHRA